MNTWLYLTPEITIALILIIILCYCAWLFIMALIKIRKLSKAKSNISKQAWEFNGAMGCGLCKFHDFGCNDDEKHCPYLAGWGDGQKKLIATQINETGKKDNPCISLRELEDIRRQMEVKHG